jgi:plastocyanin
MSAGCREDWTPIVTTERVAQRDGRVRVSHAGGLVVRLLVAAGLAVDAYVHADLAHFYDGIRASVSQGDLFRIEAGIAVAAAVIVLVAGRRTEFGLAFIVAASGFGALLLYRYVDVGRLGPLPNMYEPSWFPEKATAAVAEAVAGVLSAGGLLWQARHREAARSVRWLGLSVAGGLLAGLAVAGFAGRGSEAPASPPARVAAGGQQVTIVGNSSLRFAPMRIQLHTGTVRITLEDSGAYPHNIVIPALGVTSPTVSGDPGGAQTSFTVTFAHPGSYLFRCQYHASAGMTGMFVVS